MRRASREPQWELELDEPLVVRAVSRDELQIVRNGGSCDHWIDAPDRLSGPLERPVHAAGEDRGVGRQRKPLDVLDVREEPVDRGVPLQSLQTLHDLHGGEHRDRELAMLREVCFRATSDGVILTAEDLGQDVGVEKRPSHWGASTDRARVRPLRLQ